MEGEPILQGYKLSRQLGKGMHAQGKWRDGRYKHPVTKRGFASKMAMESKARIKWTLVGDGTETLRIYGPNTDSTA